MRETRRSFCRICTNYCSILVDVDEGRAVQVTGDDDDPMYHGYTCVKGRAQPDYLEHPDRMLRSLRRDGHGDFQPIPIERAMDEIAERLLAIRDAHGPRAIAAYGGTMQIAAPGAADLQHALMQALGSDMEFNPNTIDKGGKQIAAALHGRWGAPSQGFDQPDVALLVGINPLVTYTGFPAGNPGRWLKESLRRGMQLLVIDPRRSDVAKRAAVHLRPEPGHDAEILAALIHVILDEQLHDDAFVRDHADGLEDLRATVVPFTPGVVAARADVPADDLVRAARVFARAARGYAVAGTGPSMSANGSLVEYLVLVLETLCGHWLREGEVVRAAPTLLPCPTYKAQASPPQPAAFGPPLRVRGFSNTPAGMPTAALADEILLPGDGQVRALVCWSGNPVLAFPDQLKTIEALRSLELLVCIDAWMTPTARLAHYVLGPTMPLEAMGLTVGLDASTGRATGYGSGVSYAQFTPRVVEPPPGSELLEEWRIFHGLLRRVGARLQERGDAVTVPLGLDPAPTEDALLDWLTAGSRVPLADVRSHPGGDVYPEPRAVVGARDPGWEGRLDIGSAPMMGDLARIAADGAGRGADDDAYPFRLLCRRQMHVFNSSCNVPATNRGRPYNPAFVHSADLDELGLAPGDLVEIRSALAAIVAVAEADDTLRRGSVSMMFGFGGPPDVDGDVRRIGSSPSRLVSDDDVYDRYMGQPRMSNVPVRLRALGADDLATTPT